MLALLNFITMDHQSEGFPAHKEKKIILWLTVFAQRIAYFGIKILFDAACNFYKFIVSV